MTYDFAGIPMNNYLVASSSPLTESVERLLCCKEAGFSAAILKSCEDYVRTNTGYPRKVVYTDKGYYADGSFENEILTLGEGMKMFREAFSRIGGDMLLIPSVSASSLEPEKWLDVCKRFQNAGAKVIQLDFFYLGSLEHDDQFYRFMRTLLTTLTEKLSCVIMPKLNIRFAEAEVFPVLAESGIKMVSLLDSIRENPDEKYSLHKGSTSYFGPRELPYTLRYLEAAKKYNLRVCAGGGIADKMDVDYLLERGADMIQVASYVLNRDYEAVSDLLPEGSLVSSNKSLLKHYPWCDSKTGGNCVGCGACASHTMPKSVLGNLNY